MEKDENNVFAAVDRLITSWASPALKEAFSHVEDVILAYSNPATIENKGVTQHYIFGSFLSVFSITVLYLIVTFGLSAVVKALAGNTNAKSSSLDAARLTVAQKFKKEPLLIVAASYNLFQVVLCAYMAYSFLKVAIDKDYSLVCNKLDLNDDSLAKVQWIFYMSKILDFVDTILIILRRKWNQLIFLHVYHHAMTLLVSWLNLRAVGDGDLYYTSTANALVHCVMYTYYNLMMFNVPVPKLVKKMVTNIQIVQFITMLFQVTYVLIYDCPFPKTHAYTSFAYIGSLLLLFIDFSRRTYGDNQSTKKVKTN